MDRGFESRSGQAEKKGNCCFSAKYAALRTKINDLLARNPPEEIFYIKICPTIGIFSRFGNIDIII